jgi:hypothetical protein
MQIILNRASVYQCEGVTLVAGSNTIDEADATALLSNPLVQADIENGVLVVEQAEKPKVTRKPKTEAE